jgi:ribonuclease Z
MLDLILLGTSGTVPLPDRPLSAVLGRLGPELILFDCGEGTQVSVRRSGWGFRALSTICLSHMHGDHVGGLPGMLLSVANAGRSEPMDLFGPPGTRDVVAGLRVIARRLPYELRIHELETSEGIAWNGATLATLAVDHSAPCLAYRIDVPRARRFEPARALAAGVPISNWKRLQHGESVAVNGRIVTPDEVLGVERTGIRFGYVTDTRPTPEMRAFLARANLLVIEGTYGDPADAENAVGNKHLLFSEAAEIGRSAQVEQIWLTHFSAKLLQPERYAHEATRISPATTIGYEGLTTSLRFGDERQPTAQAGR